MTKKEYEDFIGFLNNTSLDEVAKQVEREEKGKIRRSFLDDMKTYSIIPEKRVVLSYQDDDLQPDQEVEDEFLIDITDDAIGEIAQFIADSQDIPFFNKHPCSVKDCTKEYVDEDISLLCPEHLKEGLSKGWELFPPIGFIPPKNRPPRLPGDGERLLAKLKKDVSTQISKDKKKGK